MKQDAQTSFALMQDGVRALGAHGKQPNQALRGRETSSNVDFKDRLREMDEGRWAPRLFIYL